MSDLLPGSEPPEPTRRVRADALRRANDAWRVRVAGGSWEQAAEVAGYAHAEGAIHAVRSVFGELPAIERDELRRLWRDRLEAVARQALKDVHDRQPGAVTAFVRVAEAAMRLDGLAAPSEVIVHNPTEAELEAWVAAVVSQGRPAIEEGDIFEIGEH